MVIAPLRIAVMPTHVAAQIANSQRRHVRAVMNKNLAENQTNILTLQLPATRDWVGIFKGSFEATELS